MNALQQNQESAGDEPQLQKSRGEKARARFGWWRRAALPKIIRPRFAGHPEFGRTSEILRPAFQNILAPLDGVRALPKPAMRWVGAAGRIALREFDFQSDSEAVGKFQAETYGLNFPEFRFTAGFAAAFRHDLRRAALDPNHALFVLDSGHVAGFLWLVICENSWTNERYGYVNNLYVEESQRGQGLARELMNAGDEWFRRRGIRRVKLTVTADNAAACKLYENCGYQTTRLEMDKEL